MKPLVSILALLAFGVTSPLLAEVQILDLGGSWQLALRSSTDNHDDLQDVEATVPGNVHLDLLRSGNIPDPFYRDNAAGLDWVFESIWTYSRRFEVPPSLLARDAVLLRCEGLDTVARIEVNGRHLADTDNMYRTWLLDVKPLLQEGSNEIRVTFTPMQDYIEAFCQRAPKVPNATGMGIANIRKSPYSNGWDFCERFRTCGIYKPIELVGYDIARVTDVRIEQDLTEGKAATLRVTVDASAIKDTPLVAETTVSLQGTELDRQESYLADGSTVAELEVASPQLWWPNGMGDQPLYDVSVELRDRQGQCIDIARRRIGLRSIELLPKADERPLRLAVNGLEIFAKGANWIPLDVFPARVRAEQIGCRVADAAAANMNMLRVWGGGYYPEDAFFDACDEQGILVWSDFMFACAAYPGNNPEFQENVRAELTDQMRRLRHHPSVAVWCGNNEVVKLITDYNMITQEEYDRLFHTVIGTKVKELHPQANYVGGSPEAGDEHNWWVWHVGADFEHYRQSHGWITEFGFQSFPQPATVRSYTNQGDRDSVLSEVNLFHQKNGNGKGNDIILDKLRSYFREPKDFESTLWLSQILQAYGMSIGMEHWRTDWPNSSGALVWQFNDCWPGPSWSCIDYYGRPKAALFAYKRAFAPVMISGIVTPEDGMVELRVASDLKEAAKASIEWRLTDLEGRVVAADKGEIGLVAGTSVEIGPTLVLENYLAEIGRQNALLWLEVRSEHHSHTKLLTFARPKNLDLNTPDIKADVSRQGEGFDVTLVTSVPALWTWLECADADARYSDNFVHLFPGEPVVIHVAPSRPMQIEEFRSALKVRSLYDTYTHHSD